MICKPELLVTGHFEPIAGADRINAELTRLRNAIQYIHDQTVAGMNAGKDVRTLMREITLPAEYEVGQGYGKVAWDVRAIWENYSGWFHHRSTTELYPVGFDAVSRRRGRIGRRRRARGSGASTPRSRAAHCMPSTLPSWFPAQPDHPGAREVLREAHEKLLADSDELLGKSLAHRTDSEKLMTARVSFDFTGTEALITGGTSGIGHATAVLFRDAGAEVTITGTKPAAADYDVDLSGMAYRQLQITDHDSVDALAQHFTRLDVLVNNAGANFPGGLDESKPDGFEASVALNLTGPYRLTVALYRALKASTATGGASVVNLASMSALRAVPLVPGYGAAKAGVIDVTRNLAVKWAGKGIRVNAVAPGTIDTPMTAPMHIAEELVESELAHIPLRRFGSVGEIAPTVAFLCTEQSRLHQRRGLRRRRRIGLHLKLEGRPWHSHYDRRTYYHTGIVVPDLEAAMARLSALAGYRWITPLTYTLPFRTATGTRELTSTFVYSLQSPHLELIQEVPGQSVDGGAGQLRPSPRILHRRSRRNRTNAGGQRLHLRSHR